MQFDFFPHCTGNPLPMPLLQAVALNFFRNVPSHQVQDNVFPVNIATAYYQWSIYAMTAITHCSSGRLMVSYTEVKLAGMPMLLQFDVFFLQHMATVHSAIM